MQELNNGRKTMSRLLKTTTALGLAAAIAVGGLPLVSQSFAQPVTVQAPQVPSFADVVSAVSPAVVSVRVESNVQPAADDGNGFGFGFGFGGRGLDDLPDDHPLKRLFPEFGSPNRGQKPAPQGKQRLRPTAQGSGFFISDDGYIVTNNHVVADGAAFVVVMNDGTELDARLVGKDPRTDLAVLKVDKPGRKFTYVKWADDEKVRVGDWVVAIGNPLGLGGTVTAGIVSALNRNLGPGPYNDYIQIDAAVNRGNSGGPDFNLSGEVVGINTAILTPSGGNIGLAFAIPASTAKGVVADLMKNGTVTRGLLGVQIQPVNKDIADSLGLSEASGALVVAPQPGSPGEKAGIKQGDVITAVNGEPIKDAGDLARRIGAFAPGTRVEVSLWRNGKPTSVSVDLGTQPAEQKEATNNRGGNSAPTVPTEQALSSLGLSVTRADDGRGLTVTKVDPDSDAADKGIRVGERITSVNNKDVASSADIQKVLDQAKKDGRTKALFQVESDSGSRFVALPINQG